MIRIIGAYAAGAGATARETFGMNAMLLLIGRLAGTVGVVACVAAILLRLAGRYYLGPIAAGVALQGGMAALLIGCFCLLLVTVSRKP
jgi:hypothetical protein